MPGGELKRKILRLIEILTDALTHSKRERKDRKENDIQVKRKLS